MESHADESLILEITRKVALMLENGGAFGGLYGHVDTAVTAALKAQQAWQWDFSHKERIRIINEAKAELAGDDAVNELALLSVAETGMGRARDKTAKIRLALEKTPGPESFKANAVMGDHGLALEELSPFGVIASLVPSIDAAPVVFCNALNMISGANAAVITPHPDAIKTALRAADLLSGALAKSGAPEGLVSAIRDPGAPNLEKLINHRSIAQICVTGGSAAVSSALRSGKPVIAAGPGNPPVMVDGTADLRKAARDIVSGCSFDNNSSCLGEKALFVTHGAANELLGLMMAEGAVTLPNPRDARRLMDVLLKGRVPDKRLLGKSPCHILAAAGISVPKDTKLILVETGETHPFVQEEIMAPILPLVRVADFEDGLAAAIRAEHSLRHSSAIYSANIRNMSRMARAMGTSIFTKNAPVFSAIGYNGDCPTAFTIATVTGQGPVTPVAFCRTRRCVLSGAFSIV